MLQKVPIISEHYLSTAICAWIATARRWSLACWVWDGKRSNTHSNIQIYKYKYTFSAKLILFSCKCITLKRTLVTDSTFNAGNAWLTNFRASGSYKNQSYPSLKSTFCNWRDGKRRRLKNCGGRGAGRDGDADGRCLQMSTNSDGMTIFQAHGSFIHNLMDGQTGWNKSICDKSHEFKFIPKVIYQSWDPWPHL